MGVEFCSSQLGCPARRPRVWMLCIRQDVAAAASPKDMASAVKAMLKAAFAQQDQPSLRKHLRPSWRTAKTRKHIVKQKPRTTPKWLLKHREVRAGLGCRLRPLQKGLPLSTREAEVLQIRQSQCPNMNPLAVDVSQSCDRSPVGHNICQGLSFRSWHRQWVLLRRGPSFFGWRAQVPH